METAQKINLARHMRHNPTKAEEALHQELAWLKTHGEAGSQAGHYIRQYVQRGYILDIFFPQAKLAVEVDGDYHKSKKQQEYDIARDRHLRGSGTDTIRFTDEEILENPITVADKIYDTVVARVTKKKRAKDQRKKRKNNKKKGHLTRMTPGRGIATIRR